MADPGVRLPNHLLICFDGTGCDAKDGTNIRRLYDYATDLATQKKIYIRGLGSKDHLITGKTHGKGSFLTTEGGRPRSVCSYQSKKESLSLCSIHLFKRPHISMVPYPTLPKNH